jgi:hypothetical protein
MLGKTVIFLGKDFVDQLRRFVAILGKPKLEIFSNLDPTTAQGLARVFKDIPDREKVDWKFLFPKVIFFLCRQVKRSLTFWTRCWSMTQSSATLPNNASTTPSSKPSKAALVLAAKRSSTSPLTNKNLPRPFVKPFTTRSNATKQKSWRDPLQAPLNNHNNPKRK